MGNGADGGNQTGHPERPALSYSVGLELIKRPILLLEYLKVTKGNKKSKSCLTCLTEFG